MKPVLWVLVFCAILHNSWQLYCPRVHYNVVVGHVWYSYCSCKVLWWCFIPKPIPVKMKCTTGEKKCDSWLSGGSFGKMCCCCCCCFSSHRTSGYREIRGTKIVNECCPGWRGSGCNTPICNPPCSHGGTCSLPNQCKCPDGYTGKGCQTETCSHLIPCFPGSCAYPNTCHCDSEFAGSDRHSPCITLKVSQKPIITQSSTTFINLRRSNNIELYRYIVASVSPNTSEIEFMWSNKKSYNFLAIGFDAIYTTPNIDYVPPYIKSYGFGITEGSARLTLTKIPRKGQHSIYLSLNKTYSCNNNGGSEHPKNLTFSCNITEKNFDRLLEHGDNLTISVKASSGGYRRLLDTNTKQVYGTQHYSGQSTEKMMRLQFDFYTPYHCSENRTCPDVPLTIRNGITKNPFRIEWHGWKDDMSGVYMYTWQVYRLEPNRYTGNLTEVNPKFPFYKAEIDPNNFTEFPLYTPHESGMYSILLEVGDSANNTRYARQLVLYDNTSSISINKNAKMKVVSAANQTNFRWQSDLSLPIKVAWTKHFENTFHVENKLLNFVDRFHLQSYNDLDFGLGIQKKVDYRFEATRGERTLKNIPNVHGIVKFQYGYDRDHNGGANIGSNPKQWYPVNDSLSETQTFNSSRTNGDTIRIWIKAFDAMTNTHVDYVDVNFDSTNPHMERVHLNKNVNGTNYPFGSKVTLQAYDRESGIYRVVYRLIDNDTGEVFHEGHVEGNKSDKTSLSRDEGDCTPTKDCFYVDYNFELNNCWMVVKKEKLAMQEISLEITAYNQAMLPKTEIQKITNLTTFDGIDEYSGPRNLRVAKKLKNGIRLKWDISASCYTQTEITVVLKTASGDSEKRFISANADWFDIVGLKPLTNYTLEFTTHYGEQISSPESLAFVTNPESPVSSLSTGAKAGIGVSVVLVLALCVMLIAVLVLWRRGRLAYTRERIRNRMSLYFSRNDLPRQHKAYNNSTYNKDDEDDLYLYGNMTFKTTQSWEVPHSDIVLENRLQSGRFADIYRGSWKRSQTVVAKVLKPNYTTDDMLLMKAKINFYATEVGKHSNVLQFIGAVVDNELFGPYMLLEHCELGPLKEWLGKQQHNVQEQTVEQFFRIALDVAKGMEYLASKKIIHNRLAARNVLLNSNANAKIAGFGPGKYKTEFNKSGSEEEEVKERVPVKWVAPECLVSKRNATIKSDVWSFGILLWEIFSCGSTPYPNIRSHEVGDRIREGYRMERPEFASDFFYDLMKKCWEEKPKSRPTFKTLASEINKIFNASPTDDYYYT